MRAALIAVLLACAVSACQRAREPDLWQAFDLLVLADDAADRPTLFRCPVDDDWETWGPPEPVLADPRWAGAVSLTAGADGDAYVVTNSAVFAVTPSGDVTSVWSHERAGDLVHLAFDPAGRRAFVTDRSARAIHVVDVSTGEWRDERTIRSNALSTPIATRVVDGNTLEILDRESDALFSVTLCHGDAVSSGRRVPRDADPVGLVGTGAVLDANPEHAGIATVRRLTGTLPGYPIDLYYDPESGAMSHRRRALVGGGLSAPGVSPVAGTELVAHAVAVLGTSADGACLVFSARMTDASREATVTQTLVPCPDLGRPLGIALVE